MPLLSMRNRSSKLPLFKSVNTALTTTVTAIANLVKILYNGISTNLHFISVMDVTGYTAPLMSDFSTRALSCFTCEGFESRLTEYQY